MREANTILTVLRERGRRGLPLERVYRLLYNRDLYLRAYARLYSNTGAMTAGSTDETVDGMSLEKIDRIIEALRSERYRWTPVRRTYIRKKNGKLRPLGLPSWTDKLLQEVIRSVLEAYYEPQFSPSSHGFRPERGCHTALREIQRTWKGTKWFIEGDIHAYFDTIDHDLLINILSVKIHDGRLLQLIRGLLKVGYLEDWGYHPTLSGAPQGGVLSPLLSNIYLDQFDQWVETTLVPAYSQGDARRRNPAHRAIEHKMRVARQREDKQEIKRLLKARRLIPSKDPNDANYRRLRYARYADDWLLGFAGPKAEAEGIKRQIREWLHTNLRLTLSDEKTLITHAATQAARFLNYDIVAQWVDDKLDPQQRRSTNAVIGLRVPARVIHDRCQRYMRNGVILHRTELTTESDYDIVTIYQAEYRGVVQYYQLASNVHWFSRPYYAMRASLLKTLACKHNTTVGAVARKLKDTVKTPEGQTLRCLTVRVERDGKPPLVARFGGISRTRQPMAIIKDQPLDRTRSHNRSELVQRLLAQRCALCGATEDIEIHHIRALKDLNRKGRKEKPLWVQRMAARRRKYLEVCHACHADIHAGRPIRARQAISA